MDETGEGASLVGHLALRDHGLRQWGESGQPKNPSVGGRDLYYRVRE
jgi:hypothetical protein